MYRDALKYIIVKKETVAGTPVTVSNSDFDTVISVNSIDYTPNFSFDNNNNEKEGLESESVSLSGARTADINFSMNWFPNSDLAAAPSVNKMLTSCGLADSSYGGTSYWSSEPSKTAYLETLTIVFFRPKLGSTSKLYKTTLVGCIGNARISGQTGKTIKSSFSFRGAIYSEVEVEAPRNTIAAPDTKALTFKNTPFYIDSTQVCVTSFALTTGNVIEFLPNQGLDYKIQNAYIKKRRPRLTITPYMTDKTIFNFFDESKNDSVHRIDIEIPNLNIICPRAQLSEPKENNTNGFMTHDIKLNLLGDEGEIFGISEESQFLLYQV